jgi:hypothetical protein
MGCMAALRASLCARGLARGFNSFACVISFCQGSCQHRTRTCKPARHGRGRAHAPASQGSGWGWLGYSKDGGKLVLETTANQDPLSTKVRVRARCPPR